MDYQPGTANEKLRRASGEINYPASCWLTSFLYDLMRDGSPPGKVEEIVRRVEEEDRIGENMYSNGWLAQYASYLAYRLKDIDRAP